VALAARLETSLKKFFEEMNTIRASIERLNKGKDYTMRTSVNFQTFRNHKGAYIPLAFVGFLGSIIVAICKKFPYY
jgi:hypothetical protein